MFIIYVCVYVYVYVCVCIYIYIYKLLVCVLCLLDGGEPWPLAQASAQLLENMVGVDMVLAQYPQNTLYHRIYIIHD